MFEIILTVAGVIAFLSLRGRVAYLEDEVRKFRNSAQNAVPASPVSTIMPAAPTMQAPSAPTSIAPTFPSAQTAPPQNHEDSGGKWLGKIGIFALLAGVAFFLKYAFDNDIIGVHGRIILGFAAGVFMLGLGEWLRNKYKTYSELISGGGIALLYLTTFAAFVLYSLIGATVAYGLMIVITAVSVVMSVAAGAPTLAGVGVFGAFATPVLIAMQAADPLQLFTYILIVDIGVAAVIFAYKWWKLQYLAFLGTALLSAIWYGAFFTDTMRVPLFLFATLYFAVFLVSSMLHHVVRKEISDQSDALFVSLNGLLYAWVGYILWNPTASAYMGYFMLALAALYFLVGYIAFSSNKEDKLLNLALPGLSVVFLTLAIPLHLSGAWITIAWLAEALLLFALDYAVRGRNLYTFGSIVFSVGLVRYFAVDLSRSIDLQTFVPFANQRFMIGLFAVVVSYGLLYFIYREYKRQGFPEAKSLVTFFAVVTQLLSLFLFTTEINTFYAARINTANETVRQEIASCERIYGNYAEECQSANSSAADVSALTNERNTAVSIFLAIYAVILLGVGFSLAVRLARILGLFLFFITAIKVFVDVWSLGPLYRIVSSIVFGIVALAGSFLFAKFKDKIKQSIQ